MFVKCCQGPCYFAIFLKGKSLSASGISSSSEDNRNGCSHLLHQIHSHLDKLGGWKRIIFFGFSSAFTIHTIQPLLLCNKLEEMQVDLSFASLNYGLTHRNSTRIQNWVSVFPVITSLLFALLLWSQLLIAVYFNFEFMFCMYDVSYGTLKSSFSIRLD